MASVYIALVHYPVVNKQGALVTTSLTNFDLHDLGRTSTTYGVARYFVVTPVEVQQEMARYIKEYWRQGLGSQVNPDRKDAFASMDVARNIEETCLTIKNIHGIHPRLVATSAKAHKKTISFKSLRAQLETDTQPYLILFGTGWGLAPQVIDLVDDLLEPIRGPVSYNHLPVRSAVAIVLDRLLAPDFQHTS